MTLLATITSAGPCSSRIACACSTPKKPTIVGTPIASAAAAGPGDGIDAERRHAGRHDVAQQVPVVARHLDDERRRTEPALPR